MIAPPQNQLDDTLLQLQFALFVVGLLSALTFLAARLARVREHNRDIAAHDRLQADAHYLARQKRDAAASYRRATQEHPR